MLDVLLIIVKMEELALSLQLETFANGMMLFIVVVLALLCGALLLAVLVIGFCYCRRSTRGQEVNSDLYPSVRAQSYRRARKSDVYLETIDEDFTVPGRRLRAKVPSSASFREVTSGLGAANRAMEQLSRVGQQEPQSRQARRLRDNLEPTYDHLVFDDLLENIESRADYRAGTDRSATNNNLYAKY